MKKKSIIIVFIAVLGVSSALYGLTFVESRTERGVKSCIFEFPMSCGPSSDDVLFESLRSLNMSSSAIRERLERNREIHQERLREWTELSHKKQLTREEQEKKCTMRIV